MVCSRLPFTCGRLPLLWKRAEVFINPGDVLMAPGISRVNVMTLRPFKGTEESLAELIASPVAVDSV